MLKNGIDSLEKQTSSINTTLKNGIDSLEKQTSSINTTLKNGIDSLEKQTLDNNAHLQAIKNRLPEIGKHLEQIQQLDEQMQTVNEQNAQLSKKLKSQKATINSIKEDLDEAKQAQNSVRLLIGSEDSLTNKGFLETSGFLWLKSYRLVKELSAKDTLVTIGEPFPLESASQELVDGSGPLVLESLVSHSGKLKKHEYEIVKKDSTFITFKSFLGGMHILAVVKRE